MTTLEANGRSGWIVRVVLTVIFCATLVTTLVFNGLAGPGLPPFTRSTGNVSDEFNTCITPAGFTFSIWGLIYACLVAIAIYVVSLLFRRVGDQKAWQLGGAVTSPFLLVLTINLIFNITWLFLWDAADVTGSAVLLVLIALSNATAISMSAVSFGKSASQLYVTSKADFWMGIFVLNGHGFYDTWTTLAALINLTAFFKYQVGVDGETVCIVMLSFVLISFFGWFILENTVLKLYGNPLITHYMVIIWASYGIYEGSGGISNTLDALIITNIAVFSAVLIGRLVILGIRNWRNGIYGNNLILLATDSKESSDNGHY